eukprot:Em0010g161a
MLMLQGWIPHGVQNRHIFRSRLPARGTPTNPSSLRFFLAVVASQTLTCYNSSTTCTSTSVRLTGTRPAGQCCLNRGGRSYRASSSTACAPCAIYGFFQSPNSIAPSTTVYQKEGSQLTVYFGFVNGTFSGTHSVSFSVPDNNRYIKSFTTGSLSSAATRQQFTLSIIPDNIALLPPLSVAVSALVDGSSEFVLPFNAVILDADVVTIGFRESEYTVTEGASPPDQYARVKLAKDKTIAQPLSVQVVPLTPNVCEGLVIECKELMIVFFVVSDIPNGPMDFDKSILNLTFTSSQRELGSNVAIVDDQINEADQQFICIVRLTNPSVNASGNVIIKNPSTVITIADDDQAIETMATKTKRKLKESDCPSVLIFSKEVQSGEQIQVHSENEEEGLFVDIIGKRLDKAWFAHIRLCKHNICFKLDTGAEVTAISQETYQQLGTTPLNKPSKVLYGAGNQPLDVIGQFTGIVSHKELHSQQTIFVIKNLKTNLLGLPALHALKLIARMDSVKEYEESIQRNYPQLFTGLGTMGSEYTIQLKPNPKPYSLSTPRNIPLPLRDKVKEELERMTKLGVISKVETPMEWCAGMVVVPKKSSGSIRICVDLRPLNENVMRENFPLPKVDEILAQLAGERVFSKLDANMGFWQIPLSPECRSLTTFITPFGRFHFNKLPFGVSCASELFQRRMAVILEGLEGVLCLVDDVLVFGSDQQEYDRLRDLTQPLRELLSARNVWQWSRKHYLAFAALKQEITKPSTLALYNPQVATKISTDASSYGLGAVLLQEEQGSWKPVAFASKALTETELRYAQIEKEALAIVWALIGILKSVFARFGIPEILVTDKGPQYASKHMAEFAKSYGFQHTTSSPYYPQGNGQAERTVKTVKTLIQNADDPFLALLNYRATPLPWCNLSPAELLFGCRIRTTIPQLPCQMVPSWPYLQKFCTSDEETKQRQKENYDLRHGVKTLPELEHGTEVWVTNRGKRGTITSKTNIPRSYIINTPEGTIRRNRRHLIAVPRASAHCAENNPGDDENHSHDDGDTPEVKETTCRENNFQNHS